MEKHCRIIATAILVIAVIGAVLILWSGRAMGWPWIISMMVSGGISVYVMYVLWETLAEILDRLERLQYRLYELEQEPGGSMLLGGSDSRQNGEFVPTQTIWDRAGSRSVRTGRWRCPTCGRENENYTGTCACGCAKPGTEMTENHTSAEPFLKPGRTGGFCVSCGQQLDPDALFCTRCGRKV